VVYVAIDPVETEKVKKKWVTWGDGIRLKVIESPYRTLIEPLIEYIDQLAQLSSPAVILTVVVPQFIPEHAIYKPLHMNTAELLRKALLEKYDIGIMEIPYHLEVRAES
jgi:hypothetical protein